VIYFIQVSQVKNQLKILHKKGIGSICNSQIISIFKCKNKKYYILELVTIIAEIFFIEDQDIFDAVINRSDELAHFIDYYKLKTAS
jgi:hypothetical protein